MGIREHLRQQKEEDEEENFKIENFSFDVQKSEEPVFDPEEEIKQTEWDASKDLINEYLKTAGYIKILELLSELSKISKPKTESLDLEQYWWAEIDTGFEDYFRNNYDMPNPQEKQLMNYLVKMRYILPKRLNEKFKENPEQAEKIWNYLQNDLAKTKRDNPKIPRLLDKACDTLSLFPERRSEIDLNDTYWQKILENLNYSKKEGGWQYFAVYASKAKLLYPNKPIDISEEDYDQMKEILRQAKDDYYRNGNEVSLEIFFDIASALTILSADRATITDQGLKLETKEPDFKQQKQKRPERKSF